MAEPAAPGSPTTPAPYSGGMLALLTFVLAMANMMEVLDLTIANVSIPTITGDLAVSPNQGTWVITSYAIANAITVPMTGWFAQRYGQVRVFTLAIALFTGPILGGWITDNYHWSWIFLINIPVGVFASLATWQLMKDRETPTRKLPIDGVGVVLLIVWVGALQLMLDKGNELDWFHSGLIQACAVVAVIGFALFIAWELTDDHPVVDLGVFRYPNFRRGALTLSLGFSLFFANIVILPLWLQTQMGYPALWAGFALAPAGVLAVAFSPFVGIRLGKGTDPRILATVGFLTFTVVFLWRAHFNTGADFVTIALPQ